MTTQSEKNDKKNEKTQSAEASKSPEETLSEVKQAKAQKPKQAKKSKETPATVKANVAKDIDILAKEQNLVHVRLTDYALNRGTRENPDFPVRTCKFEEQNFVDMFAPHWEANGAFANVNSSQVIYRILKNLNEEIFEEAYEREYLEAVRNLTRHEKKAFFQKILKDKKVLRLNGSTIRATVEDFIHVPNLTEPDKFPEEV